jgi:hypothetical protein
MAGTLLPRCSCPGAMVTASAIAASALSRRPRRASRSDRLFRRAGQGGAEGVGAGGGQLPVEAGGFPARGQRVFAPTQVGQNCVL